jgi:hyperosmotically inducible protein
MSALMQCVGLVLAVSGASAQPTTNDKATAVVTDSEITNAVKTKLLADQLVGSLDIDVETTGRIVTLTGTVESAAEKAHAIELARRTHGVKNVVNRLTIVKKGTDESITTAVKTRLGTDTVARSSNIDVEVKSRVVTISGVVPAAADKTRIGRLVAHTSGVKSVENNLIVK